MEALRMDPLTPLDTLCRIILRAREYEAQTPTDYDGGEAAENVDDDDEGTLVGPRRHDQRKRRGRTEGDPRGSRPRTSWPRCWPSAGSAQGTYDAADWDEAMEEAMAAAKDGEWADRRTARHADAGLGPGSRPRRLRAQLRRDRRPQLAPERPDLQRLPRPAQVTVQPKPVDAERPRREAGLQRLHQCPRLAIGNLVLDGDVRPPAALVLRAEHAVERLRQLLADAVEIVGDDRGRRLRRPGP